MFARDGADVPKGNRELLKLGAAPLAEAELRATDSLANWLRDHAKTKPVERDLFG